MTRSNVRKSSRFFTWMLRILYALTLLCVLYFLVMGIDFYLTPLSQRPRHELFRSLKPGGLRSHGLGIVGSLMLISLLSYTLRKRWRLLQNLGNLSYWLNIHIFFGVCGPLFIILHSTLKLNGLIAVAFWSMVAVALSGVLGRYLYLQIPRNIKGHELSLQEIEEVNKNLAIQLQQRFQLEAREIQSIEMELVKTGKKERNTAVLLLYLIGGDLGSFFSGRRIKRQLVRRYHLPGQQISELFHLLKQKAQINRRILLWNKIHQLFHYWHVFHKPFAVIMYLIMSIHIGIALWLGYRWIF